MALGNILRETREARGLSTNEVAEHTNMMVQIVEELEREDFHRIAAPIYGRGFLKLYAELLKIDVEPLIEEFMDIYTGNKVPAIHRKEVTPAAIKKPVVADASISEQEESGAPRRVEIKSRHAARSAETTAPKPLPLQKQASEAPVEPEKIRISVPEPEPVVSVKPAEEPRPAAPVSEQPKPHTELPDTDADVSVKAPPQPADDLFGADEPNLFNTTPLQERIAEARRLMDEKESAKKEEEKKKKASLRLGANQSLPVFQIGGRMGKTYETKPRKTRASSNNEDNLANTVKTIGSFFSDLKIRFPSKLRTEHRNIFVFGALGVIIFGFLCSGVMLIFKLTKPAAVDESGNKPAMIETVKKSAVPVAKVKDQTPPPPDMYFD